MKYFLGFFVGVLATIILWGSYQWYFTSPASPFIVWNIPTTLPPVVTMPDVPNTPPVVLPNSCASAAIGNGYSFCIPVDHTSQRVVGTDGSVNFTLTSRTTGDTITIEQKLQTVSYTDSDSKFGDVMVSYNSQKKIWEATGACDSPTQCNRSFVSTQWAQVFIGRSRWLTYIVPLNTNTVLVFNSTGGGYTKPLEELIQTLIVEK
jgi:hypothetical protein